MTLGEKIKEARKEAGLSQERCSLPGKECGCPSYLCSGKNEEHE